MTKTYGKEDDKDMVKIEFMLITPTIAERMLSKNHENNRKVKTAVVDQYSRDMLNGKWMQTGESIKFDLNGNLVDGQHRLLAVVKSGESIYFPVAYDIDHGGISVIDSGVPRTCTDSFKISGISDKAYSSLRSQSVARVIAYDVLGYSSNERLSKNEIEEIIGDFYNLCRFASALSGKNGIESSAIIYGLLKGLANGVSEKMCRAFIGCFARGEINTDVTNVNWKVVNNFRNDFSTSKAFVTSGGNTSSKIKVAVFTANTLYCFANNLKRTKFEDAYPVDKEKLLELNRRFKCDSFKEPWFGGES